MAKPSISTPKKKPSSIATPSPVAPVTTNSEADDILKLGEAISTMDCLSQGAFSDIDAIASLALVSMEKPPASFQDYENLAQAFTIIRGIAQDIQNTINCEAEAVGFNHRGHEASRRRADAYHGAKKGGAA